MSDSVSQGKYYVYTLAYPDGKVFYVGKGTKSRIDQHEAEASKGKQSPKCDIIRQIWSNGGEIRKEKIGFFTSNKEACEAEKELIAQLGRENLANLTKGGESVDYDFIPVGEEGFNFGVSITGSQRATLKNILLQQGIEPDKSAMVNLAKTIMREEIRELGNKQCQ